MNSTSHLVTYWEAFRVECLGNEAERMTCKEYSYQVRLHFDPDYGALQKAIAESAGRKKLTNLRHELFSQLGHLGLLIMMISDNETPLRARDLELISETNQLLGLIVRDFRDPYLFTTFMHLMTWCQMIVGGIR